MRRVAAVCAVLVVAALADPAPATSPPTIRVGLLREQDRVVVMSDRPLELVAAPLAPVTLDPAAYEVVPTAGGMEVLGAGRFGGVVRLAPSAGARLHVGIHPYRGILELRRTPSGRLTVINEVDLEEYLYGVLTMEVDPRWPADALKAQAVAARTLAVQSMGRFAAEGYDVRATTDSQVYGGIMAEDPSTTAAVEATRGQVVVFEGKPIFAAYHSDSGGYTESSEHVWGGRYPYLKGVPDPFSTGASNHEWIVRLDLAAFEDRLRRAGKLVSGISGVEIAETTPSGRAAAVRIPGSHGTLLLRGTELRTILGADELRSTLFQVRVVGDEQAVLEFLGRGSGHGVGLSQWGARGQAQAGRNYMEILKYYYTGVTIETR